MTQPTVRSESLWFRDGNVIIQAEETQFKVYQGLLAKQSAIFSDMFTLPQPSVGEELVEGNPVVCVSDTAEEVSFVLQAIFLRRWVAPGERIPMKVAAAFLRLGNKYDIETLRTEALKRLYLEFPSDLAGLKSVIYGDGKGTMIERSSWMYIDAANLAREQNLLSALPIALYWCCRWKLSVLKQGQRRPDGTISTLSQVNERACFLAYSELLELKEQKTFLWVLSPSPWFDSCRSPHECRAARNESATSVFFPTSATLCFGVWKDEYKLGQCNLCISVARRMHNDGRQQLWDALPGAFGLPAWEELRKERDTEIM